MVYSTFFESLKQYSFAGFLFQEPRRTSKIFYVPISIVLIYHIRLNFIYYSHNQNVDICSAMLTANF